VLFCLSPEDRAILRGIMLTKLRQRHPARSVSSPRVFVFAPAPTGVRIIG